MMNLTKQNILDHANSQFPREACGLILNMGGKEVYIPCKNIAENASDFIMDPLDFADAEDMGDVLAIVHSHCNVSPKASQADLVGCELSNLPWVIVGVPMNTWEFIKPSGYKAPLVGRSFHHGSLDCYSLIRDYYREVFKIELMDFERSENWWQKGDNLYLDNFSKAGFYEVDELAPGDLILMQVASDTVNHAAIYLGNDLLLHHLMNRLSTREVYGGYYAKITRKFIRHKGMK